MQRSFDGAPNLDFVDVEFLLCDRGRVSCDSQSGVNVSAVPSSAYTFGIAVVVLSFTDEEV